MAYHISLFKGPFRLNPVHESEERYVFSGGENPLVYKRHYNVQFQCNFDMSFYPFDVQRCTMVFVRETSGKFALRPWPSTSKDGREEKADSLFYLGQRELVQYYIDEWGFVTQTGKQ